MYKDLLSKKKKLAVIGLGYVGLPIALEFAKHFSVIGFDINAARIGLMKTGIDPSNEIEASAFEGIDIYFTNNLEDLRAASFYIVAVPTDVDDQKIPNLKPLLKASESVGKVIKTGDIVVYESTVYPGCTEEDCLPIIEKFSRKRATASINEGGGICYQEKEGLEGGKDFKYGYSPERIVPGDKTRTLTKIIKIVSGSDAEALDEIAKVYEQIIEPGVHKAKSIRIAEAAKVIENIQRDINISLMNELSIIFDEMKIDTKAVLEAAGTKWNFHKYYPGLVGGHCISIDPFYLLHKAKKIGLDPQLIAAGRRINDSIPHFIAKRLVQTLIEIGKNPGKCKILVKGITFKENVSDIRNSKVIDLVKALRGYSLTVDIVDPCASLAEVVEEYELSLVPEPIGKYDAIVVAVGHDEYQKLVLPYFQELSKDRVVLFDIKGIYNSEMMGNSVYWRL